MILNFRFIPVLIFVLGLGFFCPAQAQITDKAAFLAEIQSALRDKDLAKLESLRFTEGMSPNDLGNMKRGDGFLLQQNGIQSVSFEELPPSDRPFRVSGGKKYEPTAPKVGFVKVEFSKVGDRQVIQRLPYAIVNGGYYLVQEKSSKIDWKGSPDIELSFKVEGTGMGYVTTRYKYNASGLDLEAKEGKSFDLVQGQYFQEIVFTSGRDLVDATVIVMEGGKEVFRAPIKDVGEVRYQRK